MENGIKTVVLGEATTGKTSITTRLVKDNFTTDLSATIGASFSVGSGKKFGNNKFAFWDTAGQERFAAIIPMYYRDAKLILLVFDMSKLSSIDRLESYLEKLRTGVRHDFETIVIGNKMDLVDNVSEIDKYVREKMEKYNGFIGNTDYIYVSSKTGKNFDLLLNKIIEKGHMILNDNNDDLPDPDIIRVGDTPKSSYFSCSYCV
ncbi:MAG: GTP-binding protein [Nitrososphaeraceae archaeon]|nr:GTP-binding protein [Nitrososphaeraceae archaeon]